MQIVKEPGNLRSDFAKLAHAPHLATDYSSLGLLAALVNTQLRSVYLPRIFRAVDLDAADDHGFTVPLAPRREVWLVLPVFNGSCAAPQRKAAMDVVRETSEGVRVGDCQLRPQRVLLACSERPLP